MSSAEITDKLADVAGDLENELAKYTILNLVEKKIGVPKTAMVLTTALTGFTVIYAALGVAVLCNLVGFVYPVYASFKAIETKRKDDDTQWLTYWVVYASFTVVESFIDVILFWFPFYYSFKFGFLIWLFLPNTQGAKFLYTNFIKPMFMEAETMVQQKLHKQSIQAGSMADDTDFGIKHD